jgi:hypothetical protein
VKNKKVSMRIFIVFLLLLSASFVNAQEDIFAVARSGTVAEMKKIIKEHPEKVNEKNEYGYTHF